MKTVTATHISDLKDVVVDFLKDDNVRVFLFGSRARGDGAVVSDVDIGIVPGAGFRREKITLLRELVENLNVPYKVEIVDFTEVSEEFRREALKDTVLWKE